MNLPKIIYIMGAPGSGKGTQAQLLAEKIGYHRFSTGDAFRHVAAQNTDLGRRVKAVIDQGILGPPTMAAEIVIEAVKQFMGRGEGLIFDGTPRTLEEAAIVDNFFADNRYGRPLAILLQVDREDMEARNAKRQFCLGIQPGFAVVTQVDRKRCLAAGGIIGVRPDDSQEAFDNRWQQFSERTRPVIEQYRRQGTLHQVDGKQAITAVHQSIMQLIESL